MKNWKMLAIGFLLGMSLLLILGASQRQTEVGRYQVAMDGIGLCLILDTTTGIAKPFITSNKNKHNYRFSKFYFDFQSGDTIIE
ncbi:MAG: hypothetical protein GY699_00240 [Desulfobacteraceae bacterium]|nr:hypothetical protein [Desulfobacteraceae bacterium]